jgi:hypothetical protein
VKLTNEDYGFSEKLFRVLKKTQQMDDDILTCRFILLEWDLAIFKERIGFKKPALDDIEFDPETYDDKTDGEAIRDDSIPGDALQGNTITNAEIAPGTITGDKVGNDTISNINLTQSNTIITGYYGDINDGSFGNGNVKLPRFYLDIDGRITFGTTLFVDRSMIAHETADYVLNDTSTSLQSMGNATFKLRQSDAGEHFLFNHFDYGGAYQLANNLLTGNMFKAGATNVTVRYGNGTVIMSNTAADAKGGNFNNRIDAFVDISYINKWHTGNAFTLDQNANVFIDIEIAGIHYFDGIYSGALQTQCTAIDQGIIRDES